MWYLGIGSGVELTSSESGLLEELGYYLAKSGWNLRAGGLGAIDDALVSGASSYVKGFIPEITCMHELIIPFSQYRNYSADGDAIHAYSKLPSEIQNQALGIGERYSKKSRLKSRFQRQMLGCGAVLVNGTDLLTPVKFAITLFREDVVVRGESYAGSAFSYESNIYRLLSAYNIPLFNVANEEHRDRIINFIKLKQRASTQVSNPSCISFKKAI